MYPETVACLSDGSPYSESCNGSHCARCDRLAYCGGYHIQCCALKHTYDQQRRAANPWRNWYSRKAWKDIRSQRLAADPLCVTCKEQGRLTPANVVDHVQPHRGTWSLFFSYLNTQSLCAEHHNATKQREEHKGHEIGCGADGLPIDTAHHWYK